MTKQHECKWEVYETELVWCPVCKKVLLAEDIIRFLNERDDLRSLLLRLRNFIVKAEGHYLYGEKWTDWVDPSLPEDLLID